MQQLAQNGYTAEEVKAQLSAATRQWLFRYDLLDKNNNYLHPLTSVTSGSISHNSLAQISGTAKLVVGQDDSINFLSDRVQPWVRLRMPPKPGVENEYVEWSQGVYLLSSPVKESNDRGSVLRDVDCYDQTLVLSQDLIADRYTIMAGERYTDKIIELLDDLIEGTPPNNVVPSPAVLPTTREWEPGESKLQIINDLLSAINYQAIHFDHNGIAVCHPYQSPADKATSFTYEAGPGSTLLVPASHELDLFDVPNKWVLMVSEPDREPLTSVYINDNASSPTSTIARGRTITDFRKSEDVVDQATLDERASRIGFEASQVYEAVEFEVGMAPFHGHGDVIQINHPNIQVSGRYVCHKYEFDMRAGATVKHRVRRVVTI